MSSTHVANLSGDTPDMTSSSSNPEEAATVGGPNHQAAIMALAARLHDENMRRRQPLQRLKTFIFEGDATAGATARERTRRHTRSCALISRSCALAGLDYVWSDAFVNTHEDSRSWIFNKQSSFISWWDSFLVLGVVYSTAYTPLAIVFWQARWPHHEVIDVALDVLFSLDMLIRFRTSCARAILPSTLASTHCKCTASCTS